MSAVRAANSALRKSQGWSQEDLAAHAEVHRTYIGGIERGERNPTLETIHKLARASGFLRQSSWRRTLSRGGACETE